MSTAKPKPELLIKGSLKQRIRSLRASYGEKFAFAPESSTDRDQAQTAPPLIILSRDPDSPDKAPNSGRRQDIKIQVHQVLDSFQGTTVTSLKQDASTDGVIILDPNNPHGCDLVHCFINLLSSNAPDFSKINPWGSYRITHALNNWATLEQVIRDQSPFQWTTPTLNKIQGSFEDAISLSKVTKMFSGETCEILLEGSWENAPGFREIVESTQDDVKAIGFMVNADQHFQLFISKEIIPSTQKSIPTIFFFRETKVEENSQTLPDAG